MLLEWFEMNAAFAFLTHSQHEVLQLQVDY